MHKRHKYFITSIILILLAVNSYSQKDLFPNKHLSKAVKKTWGSSDASYSELKSNTTSNRNGNVYLVIDTDGTSLGYAYIGRVFSCRAGGCSIDNSPKSTDSFEYFDYLILFDSSPQVELVKVFNYQATHGHEICSPGWLKQFKGYTGEKEINYGNEIDAISGATISAISIIVDIEQVSTQVTTLIESQLCSIRNNH